MRFVFAAAVLSGISGAVFAAATPAPVPLSQKAQAVLQRRCLSCHGADQKGGLDLRTRAATLKGGSHGPALVPGDSAKSLLYRVLAGAAQPAMPLGSKLPADEIGTLKAWIDAGAEWGAAAETPKTPHWSFLPPARPTVPSFADAADRKWVRTPVDAFILAALRKKGLSPSPAADKRTLLRRVTVDLTGLPPTPAEIQAFLADASPNAYEKVVKRLLASQHYGERWAQHWLDVVRFGETNGFELDQDRPQAWRYRDWVVKALNEDMPYDRFLTLQLAGDQVAPDDFDARVATGFLRAGPQHVVGGNVDKAVDRQEWLTEVVTGVGNAFMGLTIQCARCHDHKYDPIPQKDYYRLQAFFAAADDTDFQRNSEPQKKAYEAAVAAHEAKQKPILAKIAEIEKPTRERVRAERLAALEPKYRHALELPAGKRSPEEARLASQANVDLKIEWDELLAAMPKPDLERRAELRKQLHALELEAPEPLPMAPCVTDMISPVPTTHVLVRGDVHTFGAEVQPGFPNVLESKSEIPTAGGRRLALAQWLTRADNPLTSRVMVNRLWQHHFGHGIVATPNDFGKNGQRPTNPALLDWLATELPRQGWSLKKMHELIVLSSAYQQSSVIEERKAKVDPDNRLLWRQNRMRLDAEAIRDSILAASGMLNQEMGGPSVRVPLEPEVVATIFTEGEPDNLWPVTPDPMQHYRRSLYLLHKRNIQVPLLAAFDEPDLMTSCAARQESVHALQPLTLLNSEFMAEQSRRLAVQVLRESFGDSRKTVDRLFIRTLGRPPLPRERAATERFLDEETALIRARIARGESVTQLEWPPLGLDPAFGAALVDACMAALNFNEFVYLK